MSGPVVLMGEALAVLNAPAGEAMDRGSKLKLTFAGAELNVAIALTRLGHAARWLSVLGEDRLGEMILRHARGEGVDVALVQRSAAGPTALMIKSPRPGAEPEVHYYRRGSAMSRADTSTFAGSAWANARILYLTGITPALSGSCREMVLTIAHAAHAAGIEIWLDPNHRRKLWSDDEARATLRELLPLASVTLVGTGEGEMLCGSADAERIAPALLEMGTRRVIVKCGEDGALHDDGQERFRVPSHKLPQVIDAIGAGDAFAAGVLSGRLDGLPWEASIQGGHALGAIVCMTRGDWEGLPTRRELEDFVAQRVESAR